MAEKLLSWTDKSEEEKVSSELSQYVRKHNDMIQKSRAKLTDVEQKTILYLVSKITKESKFDDWFEIDVSTYIKTCGLKKGSIAYIKNTLKNMADKSWWYRVEPKKEILVRWFDKVEVYDDPPKIRVKFHSEMAPFLFDLVDTFTQYTLETAFSLEGKHTRTIYELMKSYIGSADAENARKYYDVEMLTDTFRAKLGIEKVKTYQNFGEIKRKIVEPAFKEINEKTDIHMQWSILQTGRGGKVIKVLFSISRKRNNVMEGQKGIEDYE